MLTLLFVFLFGLVIGSFLNVLIIRIPKGESIVWPPSRCPSCKTPLRWYHNIPLFSWLWLKGKCAACGQPISPHYPLIELITALLYTTVALKCGFGIQWMVIGTIFALFLALSMIDLRYYAVPDSLNIAALILALLSPLPQWVWDWINGTLDPFHSYQTALFGHFQDAAILAVGFFLLGYGVKKVIKKEALGEADIIIAATMGALLELPLALFALYFAALFAMIPALIAKDHMVPFVPFLALGTWTAWLFDQPILAWWSQWHG